MSDKNIDGVDRRLREIRSEIDIYSHIGPVNEQEERERFEHHLKGGDIPETSNPGRMDEAVEELTENTVRRLIEIEDIGPRDVPEPEFEYDDVELKGYDDELQSCRNSIEKQVEIGEIEPVVAEIYLQTIDELENMKKIVENLGEEKEVRDASRSIYGSPSKEGVEWAGDVLARDIEAEKDLRMFSQDRMKETVDRALKAADLDSWDTVYTDKGIVSVNAASEEIRIPSDRQFTENELMRLSIPHEVGTHALRGANGFEQEYGVLGSGAGGYHMAEEGVALFLEEATGLSDEVLMQKYAGRLLSVRSMEGGDSFSETYFMNRENGFDHDQAWNMSLRAHRGGGFVKDHIYGEGFLQVSEYLDEGGSLSDLFVGKVSVDQAERLSVSEEVLYQDSEIYSPVDIIEAAEDILPESVDADLVDSDRVRAYWG